MVNNESMAAAHLDHHNIVEVYGVGCDRGIHYYAMRFIAAFREMQKAG